MLSDDDGRPQVLHLPRGVCLCSCGHLPWYFLLILLYTQDNSLQYFTQKIKLLHNQFDVLKVTCTYHKPFSTTCPYLPEKREPIWDQMSLNIRKVFIKTSRILLSLPNDEIKLQHYWRPCVGLILASMQCCGNNDLYHQRSAKYHVQAEGWQWHACR